MRKAEVYANGVLAGIITETDEGKSLFCYKDSFLLDKQQTAISLTLPKRREEYVSDILFPFFYNMLSEGVNRKAQCQYLKIDEEDDFGLLLAIAHTDTIGAITVRKI